MKPWGIIRGLTVFNKLALTKPAYRVISPSVLLSVVCMATKEMVANVINICTGTIQQQTVNNSYNDI